MMDLLAQLQSLVSLINSLQQQLADVPAALEEAKKLSYDQGFADGKASVPAPVSDKIFSQAELDKAVADAVLPLQAQVSELQAKVDAIPAQVDAAVVAIKADLLAKIKDLETKEVDAISALFQ